MQVFNQPTKDQWPALSERPYHDNSKVLASVNEIIATVRTKKDAALIQYAKQFDQTTLDYLQVSVAEIEDAIADLDVELKSAIEKAAANIRRFHETQLQQENIVETQPGIRCWRRSSGIEKVGLYIPGGSAPLFSTVLMLGIPAQLAGCSEVLLCTPPDKAGRIHPAILFAASCCGISRIFKAGGAQAIAAMAFGTESIPAVYKIFGPGNQYVTAAKQLLQNKVAIDMPAGPSEVLVIADDTSDPAFVAADLLSQAEHGGDSQVILVTTSDVMANEVNAAIQQFANELPRKEIIHQALVNSRVIVVESLEDAIDFSNYYAPEHLVMAFDSALDYAAKITSAGSVFIGHYSPESVGDYASGTNHTLPTNGYARMYSGVSIDSFVKKISFQQLTKEGLHSIASTVSIMAEAEGLHAHKLAVSVRIEKELGIRNLELGIWN